MAAIFSAKVLDLWPLLVVRLMIVEAGPVLYKRRKFSVDIFGVLFFCEHFCLAIFLHLVLVCYVILFLDVIHCESKRTSILLPITLADVDGFSKFFHC